MKILGKRKIDKDFLEISISELFSITGGVIAGLFLAKIINNIGLLGGLFILFPGLLELHGNIYGSLSARLGNLLLLGKLKKKGELKYFLKENIIAVLFLIIFVSFILGLIAYLSIYLFFGINNYSIIFIAVLSSLISSVFEIPLTTYTTLWIFRHKLDPEDIMGPYVTTVGDIISILSLMLVTFLLI